MALPSAIELAVSAAVMFGGATVLGTVGFGIGISTAPILLLLLDAQTVVVTVNTASLLLFLLIIRQTREHLDMRETLPMAATGLLGVPVGVFVLNAASPTVLRTAIAALILVLTVPAALRWAPTSMPRLAGPAVGFVVGAMLTGTGVGGPLMALYFLARSRARQEIRGSLALYFLVVEFAGVVGYALSGLFTVERIVLVLVATGPVLLGFGAATLIGRRMDERLFRLSALAVIVVASIVVMAQELSRL